MYEEMSYLCSCSQPREVQAAFDSRAEVHHVLIMIINELQSVDLTLEAAMRPIQV